MSSVRASWQRTSTDAEDRVIESNWLFRLITRRFQSIRSGKSHNFYVMEIPDAVHVIAVTTDQKLVMVRQFRAGSGLDSLETPGGLVEPGEDPITAGTRELLEETGYSGNPGRFLSKVWAVPSILSNQISTIVIENARLVAPPELDPTEEVQVELVELDHLPQLLRDASISHALVAQGLLTWLLEREKQDS